MRIAYEVTLPPEALKYPTAFAPLPASTTSAWSLKQSQGQTVHGYPGTRAIPAPRSAVGPAARTSSQARIGGGQQGGERYAPPYFWPNLYYAVQNLWGSIGGVRIYSDNQLPVPTRPAADPRWVPPLTKPRHRWLLGRQLGQWPNLPRFAQWRAEGRSTWPGAHADG